MQLIEDNNKYRLIKNSSNCHFSSSNAQLCRSSESYPQSYPQVPWINASDRFLWRYAEEVAAPGWFRVGRSANPTNDPGEGSMR